jgi:hypothetical protein
MVTERQSRAANELPNRPIRAGLWKVCAFSGLRELCGRVKMVHSSFDSLDGEFCESYGYILSVTRGGEAAAAETAALHAAV